MKPLTKEWLKMASYDLDTAKAMLKAGRYLYVAFMCQQALEKLIKGIIHEKTGTTPPYSHRLVALLEIAKIKVEGDRLDFFDLLTRFYLNARYPEHKRELSQTLNKKKTQKLFADSEEAFQWLQKELKT